MAEILVLKIEGSMTRRPTTLPRLVILRREISINHYGGATVGTVLKETGTKPLCTHDQSHPRRGAGEAGSQAMSRGREEQWVRRQRSLERAYLSSIYMCSSSALLLLSCLHGFSCLFLLRVLFHLPIKVQFKHHFFWKPSIVSSRT